MLALPPHRARARRRPPSSSSSSPSSSILLRMLREQHPPIAFSIHPSSILAYRFDLQPRTTATRTRSSTSAIARKTGSCPEGVAVPLSRLGDPPQQFERMLALPPSCSCSSSSSVLVVVVA